MSAASTTGARQPTVAEIFESMAYGPAPESAAPANAWLDAHRPRLGLFIGGQFRAPRSGEYFHSVNPATARPLIEVAQAGKADVEAAVAAAREAFPAWSALPGHARARYLYAIARQVQKHSRLLAVLETMDNGKPIRETRDLDIPLVARHFYHHAGWAQLMESEFPDMRPLGVCGQIIPWNFPLLMLAWKLAPALAMGNTVVLKPAEFTSVTAIAFAEILQSIGLPPGVVNIVTGDGRTGEMIVRSPVEKIAFTGSTEVGRIIRRQTAGSGKRLSLELGGKSPFVVFDDADLDSVVEGVVDAIWFNQGQVCCAGSRLLVQEDVAERLRVRAEAGVAELVGPAGVVEEPHTRQRHVDIAGLPDRLAVVERLEHSELTRPLGQDPGDPIEILRPITAAGLRPDPVVGAAGGLDRGVDVGLAGLGDLGEHLLARRADRLERLAVGAVDELAVDEQSVRRRDIDDVTALRRRRVLENRIGHGFSPR